MFPIQAIVTKELDEKAHAWLKALSENLKKEDIENLLGSIRRLTETSEKEMADSVLEVSLTANKQIVQELIGDGNMYEALMELMEPQLVLRDKKKMEEGLQQGMQQGMQQGIQQGIQKTIDVLRDFGHKDLEIKMALIKKYGLSEEMAEKYL